MIHASVYVLVNLGLAALSLSQGRHWAIFPALGWGLGWPSTAPWSGWPCRATAGTGAWWSASGRRCSHARAAPAETRHGTTIALHARPRIQRHTPAGRPGHIVERTTLLRHGIATTSACALIAAAFSLSNHGRWDVNLIYSLSIGLTSWLTIELGRWRLTRGQDIPWPGGWRGAALVVAGIVTGFVIGSLIGTAYRKWADPDASTALMHRLWIPLAVTIVASTVMSLAFFLLGYSRHLQMQAEQARRQAAEAKLTLLQAQLEPHMLFNTLANLRVLVASDPRAPGHAGPSDRLPARHAGRLAQHRACAGRRVRTPARLPGADVHPHGPAPAIHAGPAEDLAQVPVPPLLLQPLVENCIRHGLEPKLEGGHIAVRARRTAGGPLELTVADNGMGLDSGAPALPGSRFGTAQLRERLASRYGDAAHFELAALPEGGTLARITLKCTPESLRAFPVCTAPSRASREGNDTLGAGRPFLGAPELGRARFIRCRQCASEIED